MQGHNYRQLIAWISATILAKITPYHNKMAFAIDTTRKVTKIIDQVTCRMATKIPVFAWPSTHANNIR